MSRFILEFTMYILFLCDWNYQVFFIKKLCSQTFYFCFSVKAEYFSENATNLEVLSKIFGRNCPRKENNWYTDRIFFFDSNCNSRTWKWKKICLITNLSNSHALKYHAFTETTGLKIYQYVSHCWEEILFFQIRLGQTIS